MSGDAEQECFADGISEDIITALSKLPQLFGFCIEYTDPAMNLRSYYPDFVAVDKAGVRWLLETKGQETSDVLKKDAAAAGWCETASQLTKGTWRYIKVPQKEFQALHPNRLADLIAFQPQRLW